jgi:outer membrane protein assembly factor BamE (lipoprotein component of BamABCDE complex)
MKRALFILACLSCILAGCALSSGDNQHPLKETVDKYRSIKPGMSQQEVVALLGAPDEVDKKGTLHWWRDVSPSESGGHGVELNVAFNSDRQVTVTQVEGTEDRVAPGIATPPYMPGGPRP